MTTVERIFAGLDFPGWTIVAVIYGFIGWFYESTVFSLGEQGKFMDRGAFIGPFCPIYAVVCTISYDLFAPIEEWWLIVILAGLATSAVELVTSIGMEALFHKRYWDYSYYPLNLDGRISVVAGAFFGFALMAVVKWIHPAFRDMILSIPADVRLGICIGLWTVFILDIIWTTIGNLKLNKALARGYDAVIAWKQRRFDAINRVKDACDKFRIVRGMKWLLAKGKAVNRKLVAAENRIKGKTPKEETKAGQEGGQTAEEGPAENHEASDGNNKASAENNEASAVNHEASDENNEASAVNDGVSAEEKK
ncbi:MAG: putative ABC transporter permease [Lachnospiraceae bacterium]|nr:putative ABC transporter permease [Lachnospiraceae bacterium]